MEIRKYFVFVVAAVIFSLSSIVMAEEVNGVNPEVNDVIHDAAQEKQLKESSDRGSVLLLPDTISAESGVGSWRIHLDRLGREKIKEKGTLGTVGLTECAETKEMPGVFLCQSFFQADLNSIFGRASFYAEGGYTLPSGMLVPMDNSELASLNLTTQGHDLKSADLRNFFNKMNAECSGGKKELCLTSFEKEFYQNVFLPVSKKHQSFVILGFSYQAFDTYQSNVGHEMMHAQYFLDAQYQQAVHGYWLTIPESDKAEVRKVLEDEGYDPKDESLMQNEFQAFILEPGAENDRLGRFVANHRALLTQALMKQGIHPIQIQ